MPEEPRKNGPVLRIRLRWHRGRLEVRGRRRLASKALLASLEMPTTPEARSRAAPGGAWYEVVTASGEVLYRQAFPDPVGGGVEFPDEDGELQRIATQVEEAWLEVSVPDVPEASFVHLYRGGGVREKDGRDQRLKPRRTFTVDLSEERKLLDAGGKR